MSDYIRREDAINCIERMTWYHVNGRGQLVDGATSDTGLYKVKDVYKGLYDIPSADVVQVVRCDDCKYYGSRRWCELHSSVFDDNAFCSYGERREQS